MESPLEKLNQLREKNAKENERIANETEVQKIAEKEGIDIKEILDEKSLREAEWNEIFSLKKELSGLQVELQEKNIKGVEFGIKNLREEGGKIQNAGKEAVKSASSEEIDLLRKDTAVRGEVFGEQIKKLKEINEKVRNERGKIHEAEPLQEKISSIQEKIKELENRPLEKIRIELQTKVDVLKKEQEELKEKVEILQKERNSLGFEQDKQYDVDTYRDFPDDIFFSGIDALKEKKVLSEEINSFIETHTTNPLIKRFGEIYATDSRKINAEDFKRRLQRDPAYVMNLYHEDSEIENLRNKYKEIPKEIEKIKKDLEEKTKKFKEWKESQYSSDEQKKYKEAEQTLIFSGSEVENTQKKIDFYKKEAPKYMQEAEENYLKNVENIESTYNEKVQLNIENIKDIFNGKEKTPGPSYGGLKIPKNMPLGFFERVPEEIKSFETLLEFLKKKEVKTKQLKTQAEKNAVEVGFFTKKSEKEERNEVVRRLSEFYIQMNELIQKYEGFKKFNQDERNKKIEKERGYLKIREKDYSPEIRKAEIEKLEDQLEKEKRKFFENDEKFSHAKAFQAVRF